MHSLGRRFARACAMRDAKITVARLLCSANRGRGQLFFDGNVAYPFESVDFDCGNRDLKQLIGFQSEKEKRGGGV